jgi:transposase
MKKFEIIGIDVSKLKLDFYLHTSQRHFVVENNNKGFAELIENSIVSTKCKPGDLLVCFENTGKYSKPLSAFLQSQNISFVMLSALEIKKSLGLTRGKNDKIDSVRIANYAYQKRETLSPTILPGPMIDKMKSLLSLREKMIRHRTAYKNGLTDVNDCYNEGENDLYIQIQMHLIEQINDQVNKIEAEIQRIIQSDQALERNFKLVISVVGVGQILAFYMIAYTNNFTSFDNPRSFACFAGIAPFEVSSGTRKGNARVHPYANKQIKSLLNLGAMSAIRIPGELKNYFRAREKEGKNNMSTLNIIRNKIVFRIFAVVKRGIPYVNHLKFAA